MEDKLKNIGFYTLEDERARNVSFYSPLWRCELLLTSHCNFNCVYCRGFRKEDQGDLSWDDAKRVIDLWCSDGLKNVRFSGGEPTLWKYLTKLVEYCNTNGVERIAISTNGSASLSLYKELINAGVNDFSISLDSCCSATVNKMAGNISVFDKIVYTIKELSKLTYVTIGTVLVGDNENEIDEIIKYGMNLGVSDIRLITAAQRAKYLPSFDYVGNGFPILKYRLNNMKHGKPIRGIGVDDNFRCPLVLDDMAILNGKHYPCIIYLREQGNAIGDVSARMRYGRLALYLSHNCYEDPICRNNCLDVCVDYNNRVREFGGGGS